ncbi:MAG: ABC transporter ATP-binding protein [Spirochaetales bacterium]|nr:ABC transporter ATP-binding protein [Spirochaetales bacterium]
MLEIKNLKQRFPDNTLALNNINCSIADGEFVVIAGENGSGKTVLVKHFNGLLSPTEGQILLDGEPVGKNLGMARQRIGFVFQNSDSQILGQTVADDVAFGPRNLGLSPEIVNKRVETALVETGLTDKKDRLPYTLSGGEKRRLALAGVLAMESDIIVLDEPFIHLDYEGVKQVLAYIVTLHKKGKTIILITHDLEKVLAHASGLIILFKGEIVFYGNPSEGIEHVSHYNIRKPFGENRKIESMTWLTI